MNTGKLSTAEIVALVKQKALEKALSHSDNMNSDLRDWALAASRASIKDMRESAVSDQKNLAQGALPLSIISREKLLNRCAPEGADNASSEVTCFTPEYGEKSHAAAHSLATTANEVSLGSPSSPNEEQDEVNKGCASMTPDDDADTFYEIKTDLFDNTGRGKKSSTHRAKLHIRANPTTPAKDANIFMLDFYNRSREINKRLKAMEVEDDDWYIRFKGEFAKYENMLVSYDIAPKLAILKEIDQKEGTSEILGYAAGIMFQIRNQPPTVILFYEDTKYELVLDFEFNRTQGSPIYKKGIYRDPARQHLDVELTETKKKFKVKSKKDFN